jgi:uncharacterized protein YcfL
MRNNKWMGVFVAVLVLFTLTFTVGCKKKEEAPVAPIEEVVVDTTGVEAPVAE